MTFQEAINRGNNLVGIAVVGLAGFAFFPEFFLESEWNYKLDDGILFLLGICALIWYNIRNNKYTKSVVPIVFLLLALLTKFGAIFIEIKDKEDVGDDFGGVVLFLLASSFVIWLYKQNNHATETK